MDTVTPDGDLGSPLNSAPPDLAPAPAPGQRWKDPSATIFRDLTIKRASSRRGASSAADVYEHQRSRSDQELVTPSPSASRRTHPSSAPRSLRRPNAMTKCGECLGRIPYGSLAATLITGAGVACACVCVHLGLPAFLGMLRLFKVNSMIRGMMLKNNMAN
jgi:hypothetical protein